MALSTKDIKHIAELAKLKLTDKEINQYRREISGIVHYVDHLAEANVGREEAMSRIQKKSLSVREDLAVSWDATERDAALAQAPRREKKLVSVPRIFES